MVLSRLWLRRTIIYRVEAIQAIVPKKIQGMYRGCLCASGMPALNSLEIGVFAPQTGVPGNRADQGF
jgi:hypothetical protein